ncbi:MAG: PAS domain-containing protein [Oligoflexia bacterium]|nr:PAS domain-containing protein [Oligoflexia bacterium]
MKDKDKDKDKDKSKNKDKDRNKNHIFWIFFKKIALIQLVLYVGLFIVLGSIASWKLEQYILKQSKEELSTELSIIKYFTQNRPDLLKANVTEVCKIKSNTPHIRITMIDPSGVVLCDSDFDIKNMVNHSDRPEIIEAKTKSDGVIGYAIHNSKTLSMNMLYGATITKFKNQEYFLRVAIPIKNIDLIMKSFYQGFFIFILPLLILGPMIGLWFMYKSSGPTNIVMQRLYFIKNKMLKNQKNAHVIDEVDAAASAGAADVSFPIHQMLNSILDQTEKNIDQKLNELIIENAKLNALMESTEDPIVAIDLNQMIWFANKKFSSYFVSNPDEFPKKMFGKIKIIEIFRQYLNIKDAFSKTITTGTNSVEKNIYIITTENNNRKTYHFDLNITPIINPYTKQIIGAMGVFHNITERMLNEQMKEEFVCNISHEVRTPLSSIQGFFQLFKESIELTPDLSLYANKIERGLHRVVTLFDDLLKLSTIEVKNKLNFELISTFSVTEDVISILSPLYIEKKITIKTHIENGGENVLADGALLENLLINLIDNAYKYTESNGTIDICWKQSTSHTILEIKDTGIGISLVHQDKIFEKFYRIDINRSRELGGTGLGLAIVKQIVLKHKGLIEIDSLPGNGSTFRVKLPVHSKYTSV